MGTAALNSELWVMMGKYGAVLSSIDKNSFVVSKMGRDNDLDELYSRLEGPHLLGFCKSGLIVEESLVPFGEL